MKRVFAFLVAITLIANLCFLGEYAAQAQRPKMGSTGQHKSSAHVHRQNLSLGMFYGKTVAQCEKILGKPGLIDKILPSASVLGTHYERFYKSNWAGVTRIILETSDTMHSATSRKKIDDVAYEIPKGTKTWQQAFAMVGVSPKGVQVTKDSSTLYFLNSISGGFSATWSTAEDTTSPNLPAHPNDDYLGFFKKSPTGL